jgi:DNA-binding PadR family transcriptional regulator
MGDLNSTGACVLGLLDIGPPPPDRERWDADGTMTGAALWTAIQRSVGGFWSMTRSQVYQELKRLGGTGLVGEHNGHYAITAQGRVAVKQWFQDFALQEPRDEQRRAPVVLTVFFGHYLEPELLQRVVHEHRLRYERRLDVLRRIDAALDEDRSLPGSTLQWAILYLTTAIEWTDDVTTRLATAEPDPRSGDGKRRRRR